MVYGPKLHDGTSGNNGLFCNDNYDGEICIHSGSGNCSPMSKEEAMQLGVELILLAKSIE
jgi:hypothetical protein